VRLPFLSPRPTRPLRAMRSVRRCRPLGASSLTLAVVLAALVGCSPAAPQSSSSTTAAGGAAGSAQQAGTSAQQPVAAGAAQQVIKVGLLGEPSSLEPAVNSGSFQRTVKLLVYRGLYNYGTDGQPAPALAESHQVSDDQRTYTFKLRKATFQNGDRVTADDVKFTFDRILDEKTGATFRAQLSVISSVEVVDPSTVRFTLKEPVAPFLHYLALPESVIVSRKYTEDKGDLASTMMGAGPYTFKEWKKGQSITLDKYDNYYEPGLPKTASIRFSFLADDSARVNALKAGDVDIIESLPWNVTASIDSDPNLQAVKAPGPFMGLIFNTTFKPFSDPRVRQAVGYAIDRQAVIDTAFNGRGYPIWGMAMPQNSIAYDPKFDNYFSLNVDKARSLLAEAGYPNGFKARLLSTSQFAFHQQTAVVVKAELAKIGIDLDLDLPDWATRLQKNTKGDYDLLVVGTAGDINDPDFISDYYQSGDIRLNNAPGFADPRIDELLKQGRAELDPTRRKAIYDEIQQRALDESPLVFLLWREQSLGASKKVSGFTNLPYGLTFQWGLTLDNATITK
jgi:glutathione transport system substrate-binding protein